MLETNHECWKHYIYHFATVVIYTIGSILIVFHNANIYPYILEYLFILCLIIPSIQVFILQMLAIKHMGIMTLSIFAGVFINLPIYLLFIFASNYYIFNTLIPFATILFQLLLATVGSFGAYEN